MAPTATSSLYSILTDFVGLLLSRATHIGSVHSMPLDYTPSQRKNGPFLQSALRKSSCEQSGEDGPGKLGRLRHLKFIQAAGKDYDLPLSIKKCRVLKFFFSLLPSELLDRYSIFTPLFFQPKKDPVPVGTGSFASDIFSVGQN